MMDDDFATTRATESRPPSEPPSGSIKAPSASVTDELRAAVKPSDPSADRQRTSPGLAAGRPLFSLAIALLIIVSIAAIWLYSRSVARNARLGLRAERQSRNSVLVHWNGHSTAVLTAHGGVLLIEDGPFHNELKLASAELSNGALMYTPQSQTVLFHLNIFGAKGRSWSESAQFVTPEAPVPATVAKSRPPPLGAAAREKVERRNTAVALSAQRTKTARLPPLVAAIPKAEVMPQLIPGNPVLEPIKVRVSVSIDETGKVMQANLVGEAAQIDESLARAALSAAQAWLFQPATRAGQPVASQHIIEFRFHTASAQQAH